MTGGIERMARLGDVDLWSIDLRVDAVQLARKWALLSQGEQTRADGLAIPDVQRRFVAARAGLRELLARVRGVASDAIEFEIGPHGKPTLRTGPSFNLSHTADLALCAVAPRRAVGVDIELLREVPEAETIAARLFSLQEQAALKNGPTPNAFLRLWTRREAWLKALGVGLAEEGRAEPPDEARWEITDLAPRAGYVGALVIERDGH